MVFARCHTSFSFRRLLQAGAACTAAAAVLFLAPTDAGAQAGAGEGRARPRLSRDLAERLQAGDANTTTVILTGPGAQVDALAARHGLAIRKRLRTGAVVDVPARRLAELAADPDAGHLSGNQPVFSQMAVTNQAIGADQVQAGLAGLPGLTGAGVGIAIIDSGIANVPALRGRVVASVDFTDERGRGRGRGDDAHGHGTHVAGIAAAAGVGAHDDTRGVAPGAHLVSLKVLDAQGRGYAADVIEAIDWAIAHREQYQLGVINLSLGGPVLQSWRDDPLCQAVERAYRAGLVVVASAGNFGKDATGRAIYGGITAPGNSPFAITVGAANTAGTPWRSDDTRASYSSMGPTQIDHVIKPDLLAPGNRIRGLLAPGSTLATAHPELVTGHGVHARLELSGTSMAAAVVSGAAALIIEASSALKPLFVRTLLQVGTTVVSEPWIAVGTGSLSIATSIAGRNSGITIGGESVIPASASFASRALWTVDGIDSSDETVVWGGDETVVWGGDETVVWGGSQTVVWGGSETAVWAADETVVWGGSNTVVWGGADTVVWGGSATVVWGGSETVVWGGSETVVWGGTVVWGAGALTSGD